MKKQFSAMIVALGILLIFVSCSQESIPDSTVKTDETTDTAAVETEYVFPQVTYGGADFTVINSDAKVWGSGFSDIVIEEQNGEILNDTVYDRNQQIEEMFNITLKQNAIHPSNVISEARKVIMSAEDVYDVMFLCHNWEGAIGTLALEGCFYDLADITEFQFDKPWWNQNIIDQLKIGSSDSLYFALNDIDVCNMQLPVILYFNEKLMRDYDLDLPYNLVRNGKWTLDEFEKYLKAVANLNGDENWTWKTNGNSIYGYASYHMGATAILIGTDVTIIDFKNNRIPYLAVENERFYSAVQKLAKILSVEGQYIYTDAVGADRMGGVFKVGRSLFVDGALSNANILRDIEDSFGILPMPKYDENQQNYRTHMHSLATFTVIPVTNTEPDKAASVADAMAYLSNKDVRPVYYDVALPYKQLRNEDSVDMLKIILDTRSIHIGYVYDWTTSFLNNDMRTAIWSKDPNIASLIEKNKNVINENIRKTLDYYNK